MSAPYIFDESVDVDKFIWGDDDVTWHQRSHAEARQRGFAEPAPSDDLLSIVDEQQDALAAAYRQQQAALLPPANSDAWHVTSADVFVGLIIWYVWQDRLANAMTPVLRDAMWSAQDRSGVTPEPDDAVTQATAEAHAQQLAATLTAEAREVLRVAVGTAIAQGYTGPALAAQIRPLVGLTPRYAQAVQRLRQGLLAQGQTVAQANEAAAAYAVRLADARARAIAETELVKAVSAGQDIAWRVMLRDGVLRHDEWEQVWQTAADERTCVVCKPLNGKRARIGEPFVAPDGTRYDAPPIHVHCRCSRFVRRIPMGGAS